ncbi:MAG TPA: hypothetical protein VFO16_15845 [Pseudonocardiaceae bacterium]|nr:hypothetical protein [Pseudonocardiaceae bacterium]
MDRYAQGSLAAERNVIDDFLSVPLSRICLGIDDRWDEEVRRALAPSRQRSLHEGVTFNSGI